MNSAPYETIPQEQWDALVTGSPDGWPFALSSWRRLILAVGEWQLEDHSFAVFDGSQICAVVPMQLDRRSGVLGITGWGGCGPIIAGHVPGRHRDAVRAAVVRMVDETAAKLDAKAVRFSVPPVTAAAIENSRGVNPFSFCGLEDCSGIAQVIDLSPDEATLWRGLSETARQTVRKAEKGDVTIVQANWAEMLDCYYRIHQENYLRTGVTPHPKSYFSGIAQEMAGAGHSVLWAALDQKGDAVAFHNDMRFGVGTWYHTGCSTEAGLATGANYLLFWKSMRGAKAAGRQWYDCGEIFPPSADKKRNGLTLFKTRFGGEPHRFLKAAREYSTPGRSAAPALHNGPKGLLARSMSRLRRLPRSIRPTA
jgi:hypothetical protein